MENEKHDKPKKSEDTTITMQTSDFKKVLEDSQMAVAKQMADTLAAALIESKKPYVSDAAVANEELFRKNTRETELRNKQMIEFAQKNCPHMQGCNQLSDRMGDLDCIVRHQLDDNTVWGICTNCGRQFWPGDEDYYRQMNRKSGNRPSAAGQRLGLIGRTSRPAGQ